MDSIVSKCFISNKKNLINDFNSTLESAAINGSNFRYSNLKCKTLESHIWSDAICGQIGSNLILISFKWQHLLYSKSESCINLRRPSSNQIQIGSMLKNISIKSVTNYQISLEICISIIFGTLNNDAITVIDWAHLNYRTYSLRMTIYCSTHYDYSPLASTCVTQFISKAPSDLQKFIILVETLDRKYFKVNLRKNVAALNAKCLSLEWANSAS